MQEISALRSESSIMLTSMLETTNRLDMMRLENNSELAHFEDKLKTLKETIESQTSNSSDKELTENLSKCVVELDDMQDILEQCKSNINDRKTCQDVLDVKIENSKEHIDTISEHTKETDINIKEILAISNANKIKIESLIKWCDEDAIPAIRMIRDYKKTMAVWASVVSFILIVGQVGYNMWNNSVSKETSDTQLDVIQAILPKNKTTGVPGK